MKNFPFRTVKKAVKTLLQNGMDVCMAFEQVNGIDDPLNVVCRHVDLETVQKLDWCFRALQWAGFQEEDTPPYQAPVFAYKYCKRISHQYNYVEKKQPERLLELELEE